MMVTVTNGLPPVINSLSYQVDLQNSLKIRLFADITDSDNDIKELWWYKDSRSIENLNVPDYTIEGCYRYIDIIFDKESVFTPGLIVVDDAGNQSMPYAINVATGGASFITGISPRISGNTGGETVSLFGQNLSDILSPKLTLGNVSKSISIDVNADGTSARFTTPSFTGTGVADLSYYVGTAIKVNETRLRSVVFRDAVTYFDGDTPPEILDGLIAYYPFNGNANDESGHGHDGTVHGATISTNKNMESDSAYQFDGSNDYISVPHSDDVVDRKWTKS